MRFFVLAAAALGASAFSPAPVARSTVAVKATPIKVGDEVELIAGAEKGQRGKVLKIDRSRKEIRRKNNLKVREGPFVLVEGLNVKTKHCKPAQRDSTGEIKQVERPIDISNVKAVSA